MNIFPSEGVSNVITEPSVKADGVAVILKVCSRHVRNMAKCGIIPSERFGGALRFNLKDVRRALGIRGNVLWEIKEVAENLAVSERHVRNLIDQGLIPRIKLLGALRFDPVAVLEAKRKMTVLSRQ